MSTRYGYGGAARAIALIADVAALIIGLWILMYLLDANRGNEVVSFLREATQWLAGWSYDLFTFDKEWMQVVFGYGLAAVVYLAVGHLFASRMRRV
ncbi:hypothetical protein [Streptomyces sparsus]